MVQNQINIKNPVKDSDLVAHAKYFDTHY